MGDLFQPTHLLVLGVIALLVFGGKKLPELGKGLGEGLRGFKDGVKGVGDDATTEEARKKELEARAYQEAKAAAEARLAAEQKAANEQKATTTIS